MKNYLIILFLVFTNSLKSQVITTFAGGATSGLGDGGPATSATIDVPWGCIFDKQGNFYFAEGGDSRIRKINTIGYISTVAGTGTSGYNGDSIQATSAKLHNASGVAVDSLGNLYIADCGNNRVRRVDISTGIITTIAGTGVSGFSGDNGSATNAMITQPYDICFDKAGNLYITDNGNYRVRKINTSGIISTFAGIGTSGESGDGGQATAAELHNDGGIAVDSCGNIYISEVDNERIRKVALNPTCIPAAISTIKNEQTINIYPNPTYDQLNINNQKTPATYRLLNMVGAAAQQGTLKQGNNTISIQSIPNGMYMLEITPLAPVNGSSPNQDQGEIKTVTKIVKQ